MGKSGELLYARPILIYDNFCYSCTKFAQISRRLSRDKIYLVGHYTGEGQKIKSKVFPAGYSASDMFWMVTYRGAFGARSGLLPLASEIIKGMFGIGEKVSMDEQERSAELEISCNIDKMGCTTMPGFFSRLFGLLKNGKSIGKRTV